MEYRPLAVHTVHAYGASHHIQQLFYDRQSKARSLDRVRLLCINSSKCVKQERNILLTDAHAGIAHIVRHKNRVIFPRPVSQRHHDGAFLRILYPVCKYIQKNLADMDFISVQLYRQRRIHFHFELQAFLLRPHPCHIDDIREHGGGEIVPFYDLHAAGLELRHVHDLVDRLQKDPAGHFDILRVLPNLFGERLPQIHFIKSDNGVHRSTDLMAHAGEKPLLRPAEVFDLFLLFLDDPVFFAVNPRDKCKQHAEQQRHQADR